MKLVPVVAALVAASVALASWGAYEYSQYSYESGVASGLSTQVSSLASASSTLQEQLSEARGNLTSLTILRDSLQAQLAQASANAASLQGQISTLDGQITQLQSQISTYESLLSLSVTKTLVSSQVYNLPSGGSASNTTFPFVSQSTPRSWGDVGIVVTGHGPATARVSQTAYQDCIFVTSCTVSMNGAVTAGDILLVFVSGYSSNSGWQAQSVSDSFGSSFTQYSGVNWPASTNAYTDSVFYAITTSGGSTDPVTVTYNSQARHSDPIVMDVSGSNLAVYSGASADCTSSCTTSIMTSPVSVAGSYVAAANAYTDLGVAVMAGSGWTQVSTAASLMPGGSFMTGEYTTNVGGGGCSVLPLLPPNYVAKYPGYLSITGTTSSSTAVALVSFPGTTPTVATYPLGTAVSATIPIIPGSVLVQLQNCGTTSLAATLTVKEVT